MGWCDAVGFVRVIVRYLNNAKCTLLTCMVGEKTQKYGQLESWNAVGAGSGLLIWAESSEHNYSHGLT